MSAIDSDPESHPTPAVPVPRLPPPEDEIHGYDRTFWLAYLANGLVTMANAMLFRYADLVKVNGGQEKQLGLIVGVGMIGSIAIRLAQGVAIDRYGAERVWRWSVTLYTISLFLHLFVTTAYGPEIFFARLLYQASLAGFFGSSITFVSLRVPPHRMAEIVGVLGTSGFLGIMVGPLLGGILAGEGGATAAGVRRMFLISGSFSLCSLLVSLYLTRHSVPPPHRRRPPLIPLVRRYMPAILSLTCAAMGAGFQIPMTFLRPFEQEIFPQQVGVDGVGFFFLIYASVGFTTRVATRNHFSRLGSRFWIILGLILLSGSFLLYLPVSRVWHFIFPAIAAGMAHALLFPSIMSAGTSAFPRRYMGIATSLMLAMLDLGSFVGVPIVGKFVEFMKERSTAAAYPMMFVGVSSALGIVMAIFIASSVGQKKP